MASQAKLAKLQARSERDDEELAAALTDRQSRRAHQTHQTRHSGLDPESTLADPDASGDATGAPPWIPGQARNDETVDETDLPSDAEDDTSDTPGDTPEPNASSDTPSETPSEAEATLQAQYEERLTQALAAQKAQLLAQVQQEVQQRFAAQYGAQLAAQQHELTQARAAQRAQQEAHAQAQRLAATRLSPDEWQELVEEHGEDKAATLRSKEEAHRRERFDLQNDIVALKQGLLAAHHVLRSATGKGEQEAGRAVEKATASHQATRQHAQHQTHHETRHSGKTAESMTRQQAAFVEGTGTPRWILRSCPNDGVGHRNDEVVRGNGGIGHHSHNTIPTGLHTGFHTDGPTIAQCFADFNALAAQNAGLHGGTWQALIGSERFHSACEDAEFAGLWQEAFHIDKGAIAAVKPAIAKAAAKRLAQLLQAHKSGTFVAQPARGTAPKLSKAADDEQENHALTARSLKAALRSANPNALARIARQIG